MPQFTKDIVMCSIVLWLLKRFGCKLKRAHHLLLFEKVSFNLIGYINFNTFVIHRIIASLLRGLKHANIVTLHDIVHTRHTLILVFEYMDTDFSQYLERHPGGLNPKNVRLFMFQLLRGLNYCHERKILHRDLKPQV